MLNKIQQKHLKVICIFFLTFTLVFSMFKTVYADNVDVLNAPETVSVQTLENELKTATNETNTDRVKYVDVNEILLKMHRQQFHLERFPTIKI